jgi:hypothetical protein
MTDFFVLKEVLKSPVGVYARDSACLYSYPPLQFGKMRPSLANYQLSARSCAKLSTPHAELSTAINPKVDDLRDRLRSGDKTNARLRNEFDQNKRDHSPRRRKIAHQQGTSPSPSHLLSCLDSPMLEDCIAGLPHPPPPSPLHIRAATTSQPSVQPPEALSSSSHAHSPALRGNLLSRLAVPTPAVPTPSNPLPPLHQSHVPGSSSKVLPLGYSYPRPMTLSRSGSSSIIPRAWPPLMRRAHLRE